MSDNEEDWTFKPNPLPCIIPTKARLVMMGEKFSEENLPALALSLASSASC